MSLQEVNGCSRIKSKADLHYDFLFIENINVDVVKRLPDEASIDRQVFEQRHVLFRRRQRRRAGQRLLAIDAAKHWKRRDALLRQAARSPRSVARVNDVNGRRAVGVNVDVFGRFASAKIQAAN